MAILTSNQRIFNQLFLITFKSFHRCETKHPNSTCSMAFILPQIILRPRQILLPFVPGKPWSPWSPLTPWRPGRPFWPGGKQNIDLTQHSKRYASMCVCKHICTYTHTHVDTYTGACIYMHVPITPIHVCTIYTRIHTHTCTHAQWTYFQFMLFREKSITSGQPCKAFHETLLSRTQKLHFSKDTRNHKVVTTSGGENGTAFGHIPVHTRPQIDHKMPKTCSTHLSFIRIWLSSENSSAWKPAGTQ